MPETPIVREFVCKHCGKYNTTFVETKEYCDEKCRRKYKENIGVEKYCIGCGELFLKKKGSSRQYCDNCQWEIRSEMGKANAGEGHAMYGNHHKLETRIKMSLKKGGDGTFTRRDYCEKWTPEFRERVRAFFNYQCVECGKDQSENISKAGKWRKLHVHHVNYNKKVCCENEDVEERLFVTLCNVCHPKTNANKEYWIQHFTEIINTKYYGRCYFHRDELQ